MLRINPIEQRVFISGLLIIGFEIYFWTLKEGIELNTLSGGRICLGARSRKKALVKKTKFIRQPGP